MPDETCEARDSNVGSYQSLPGLLAGLAVYDMEVSRRELTAKPLWAIEIVALPAQQGLEKAKCSSIRVLKDEEQRL